ncbi:MAG: Crp/Fnr family transcriptional regulator [Chloroflexi bacterium]|nr:Crp/Fnr family transcriptional regulator [Chloroflexota bacterium]
MKPAETTIALHDFFKKIPYFEGLDDTDLERVIRKALSKQFVKGSFIFLEHGPCDGIYFVRSGQVKVFKTSAEGKEQVLRMMKEGDSFNDVPVFDGGPNPASAEAMTNSTIYMIPKRDLLQLVSDYPAIGLGIVKVFASRLRHLTMLVEDLSFRDVTARLAKILLETASSGAEHPKQRLTQQEMASLIGTAREVVGRSLKSMEEQGIIRMEGRRVIIVDKKALIQLI